MKIALATDEIITKEKKRERERREKRSVCRDEIFSIIIRRIEKIATHSAPAGTRRAKIKQRHVIIIIHHEKMMRLIPFIRAESEQASVCETRLYTCRNQARG
jgi:hypothetical protein